MKMTKNSSSKCNLLVVGAILIITIFISVISVNGAPSSNGIIGSSAVAGNSDSQQGKNTRSNSFLRSGLLSNLFRRQIGTNNNNKKVNQRGKNNDNSNDMISSASESNDQQNEGLTPTELDAQKFMDNLPDPNGNNNQNSNTPTSFRERVSESFGVLRDGVSNQFKAIRENWVDTVEDLKDTWSSGSQE